MIKQVPSYKDSANFLHANRLQALVAEKRIQVRSVLNKSMADRGMKINGTIPTEEMVTLCADCAPELNQVASKFNKMIKMEREKGKKAEVQLAAS